MCGICGFASKREIKKEHLIAMNNTMSHRGPDDQGVELFYEDGFNIGLGHCRLSILDLSAKGHQPMFSVDKRVVVAFNGEIYNFKMLRQELNSYPYQSTSDTEVIIAAYLAYGQRFVEHIQGMFSIALYDRDKHELYLVRDRIGKKPLYYWIDQENIVYASELKPIMACPGFKRVINQEILGRYLYQTYIAESDSIFRNVYKVQPGEMITFRWGNLQKKRYWNPVNRYHESSNCQVYNYQSAKSDLKERLRRSVARRLVADVEVGCFLSGGYDSSLVTAIAQEQLNRPIRTFSIGFYETGFDEAIYAKRIAEYLGTNHKELYVNNDDLFLMLDDLTYYYDEPFADSSQIPSMIVSKLAKQDVSVALSGDGGDEVFCGYPKYNVLGKAKKLDGLGGIVYRLLQDNPIMKNKGVISRLPYSVQAIAANRCQQTKTQLGGNFYEGVLQKLLLYKGKPTKYLIEEDMNVDNWTERGMLVDICTSLPERMLQKVDRASMKYALEVRCPILDNEVVDYSFRLPLNFKYKGGVNKYILRDIAWDYMPKELLERPKHGFSMPTDKWLRGVLKEKVLSYVDPKRLKEQGLFSFDETRKFISQYLLTEDQGAGTGRNYSKLVWAFYIFQNWYDRYISSPLS